MRLRIAIVLVMLAMSALAQTLNVTGTVSNPNGSAPFSVTVSQQPSSPGALFPAMGSQASSVYPWAQYPPGVTYNGGIPNRPQCGPTLTPRGGGQSDYTQISNAISNCPAGQRVQLGNGVFVLNSNETISFGSNPTVNNITLRGTGPGPGGAIPNNQSGIPNVSVCGSTPCTILYKNWQSAFDSIIHINYGAAGTVNLGTSINLASDGVQGSRAVTLASAPTGPKWAVGRLAVIDVLTANPSTGASVWPTAASPELFYTQAFGRVGSDPWGYQFAGRAYRNMLQVVKVAAVNGNVVTLESPLSVSFKVANNAQLTPWNYVAQGLAVEDMYLYGSGANGNLSVEVCDGCWIRHVESHWFIGPSVSFAACYHCELRDSYLHESAEYKNTTNGGGGYLLAIDEGTANSLVENNVIWNGDKIDVMRASGGGNVIAYNFMTDDFDIGAPVLAEAGINAGHFVGSHFELFEGNWSHKYTGDGFWGNSIYITVFRNHLTGLRPAHGWLATLVNGNGYPYCDCWVRSALSMSAGQWWHNIVGNILGYSGQAYLYGMLWPGTSFMSTQTHARYESPDAMGDNTAITMYEIGTAQDGTGLAPDPNMYQRVNRQGNYDFATNSQIWYETYGGHGMTSTGPSLAMPNSLYLTSKPAFFGSNPWPWVDPSTGTTFVLPAKARFDAGTPNQLSP